MVTSPVPIITLTLNPALDLSSSTPVVAPSDKLRCLTPTAEPGGGGINVARVCSRFGEPVEAVLPVGGSAGLRIRELLAAEGLSATTVDVQSETRQSISITEETSGLQYRFVLPGAPIDVADVAACRQAVAELAGPSRQHADSLSAQRTDKASAGPDRYVVVSGSMPTGTPPTFLTDLVAELGETRLVIDTSGSALDQALLSGAMLIKPSARELARLVDRPLATEVEVIEATMEIHRRGNVGAVLASIGAGGAVLVDDSGASRIRAPAVEVRSTVGAGDSMVAGTIVALRRGWPLVEAAAFGVATGTAAVMTDGSELARVADVNRLHPSVVIEN